MKTNLLLLTSLMFGLSCNSQNNTTKDFIADSTQERPWMAEFALPYTSDLTTDSNSLIFYYTKSLDTAITVHLKKESAYLSCVFYWITPQSRLALSNTRNHENALTQFEGLSAKLDISFWNTVKEEVNKKQFKLEEEKGYLSCCDMPYYFLSYDGRIYVNYNKVNGELLNEVKRFLEGGVITKLRAMANK